VGRAREWEKIFHPGREFYLPEVVLLSGAVRNNFGDSRIKNLQATQKIEKKGQKYI
jgi:hypothetical protein